MTWHDLQNPLLGHTQSVLKASEPSCWYTVLCTAFSA